MGRPARRIHLQNDIKPVSEFRANAAEMIEQVRTTGRPLVLTHRGRSAAVVLDVADYEELIEEVELLRDVRVGSEQADAGKGLTAAQAKAALRKRFGR